MHGVAALLLAAAAAFLLARALRVPAIPLLLLAGLGLSFIAPLQLEELENALILGVSMVLFVVGMELDPRRTRNQRRAALQVGFVQFSVLAVLGYLTSRALGFGAVEAGYVALALTASSTLVGVRLLQERRQMFEPSGRLVLGVLLLQDVLVLLAIPLVTELASGWQAVLQGLAGMALLAAATLAVRHWISPLLLHVGQDQERVLLGALAILFLFMAGAALLDVPAVAAAFLAGVSLSRFPVSGVVRAELAPIGDFFAAVFFTALGAFVRIPTPPELLHATILAALVILVTVPLVTLIAERAGFSAKPAIEAGLLLAQCSEMSLVIGLAGMIEGVLRPEAFVVISLVTLGTMLLTPVVATDRTAWWLVHRHPGRRRRHTGYPPEGHVLLLGAGTTGMPLLEDLILSGVKVVVVDDDPAVSNELAAAGVRTVRGDAADPEVLRQAGAARARLISSSVRRARDNEAVLELAGEIPVLVRVFAAEDARWVLERGGIPVPYSEAAADGLMAWYGQHRQELEEELNERLAADAADPKGA
ncbi:MAG: cation:proton antiporter [Gemmatimonadota bacterium]